MNRFFAPLLPLSFAVVACAEPDEGIDAEDALSKVELNLQGKLEVQGTLDSLGSATLKGREERYRSYQFDVRDPSVERFDVIFTSGANPEVLLLDSSLKTIAKSEIVRVDRRVEARIEHAKVAKAGTYYLAVRDHGKLTAEDKRETAALTLRYDYSAAPIHRFTCTTDKAIGVGIPKKETFSFSVAFVGSSLSPQLLAADDTLFVKGADGKSYSSRLNEETSFSSDSDISIHGKGGGNVVVDAVLHRAKGYASGYLRVDDKAEKASFYSTIGCKIDGPKLALVKELGPDLGASGDRCRNDAQCASGRCIRGIAEWTCE